jgi:hypothetical protein
MDGREAVSKTVAALLVLLGAGVTVPAQVAVVPEMFKPENRSVSQTRQFTAFGGTRSERGELLRRAEDLKRGMMRELQVEDGWQAPILIVLTQGEGARWRRAPVQVQVFDGEEAARKIQIDVAPGAASDRAAVERGVLRALLMERALRAQKPEGGRFVEPPDWMTAALTAKLGMRADGAARLYASLLEGQGMPRPDRFLRQNTAALRGRARDLHEAQSLAFYDSLSELSGGRKLVLENLMLADPPSDPLQRFAATWPELADDPARLARWWALAVARLSSPTKMEFLGAEETGRQLQRILGGLEGSGETGDPGEELLGLSRVEEGRFRLGQAAAEAQRLVFRSHPLYAPVVSQYQTLLEDLARGRRRGFARRFTETEDLRLALDERTSEITDYMNWYQANAPGQETAVTVTAVGRTAETSDRRNDRISRYLDSVEQRGW